MGNSGSVVRSIGVAAMAGLCAVSCGSATEGEQGEGESWGSAEQALGTCSLQALPIAAAAASSSQGSSFAANRAIDGSTATRWSSGQGAPQWLQLDLGQRAFISSLKLDWEAAFSPSYEIQVSDDGVSFARVRQVVGTGAGLQEVTGLDVDARYVRIQANQVSGYGSVSLREVGVVGTPSPACSATAASCGASVRLVPVATSASSSEFSYTPASDEAAPRRSRSRAPTRTKQRRPPFVPARERLRWPCMRCAHCPGRRGVAPSRSANGAKVPLPLELP